jgi:hypothetical protein
MHKEVRVQGKLSCEVCGKSEDECFEVHLGGERHIFDSFECTIRGLLPKCPRCGGLILGSGIQVGDLTYCSYACASLPNALEF